MMLNGGLALKKLQREGGTMTATLFKKEGVTDGWIYAFFIGVLKMKKVSAPIIRESCNKDILI